MNNYMVDILKKSNIICWGLGRHFYSSTYNFLVRNGLVANIFLLVDKKEIGIDKEKAPLLVDCPVSKPDKINQYLKPDTIILISVADYSSVVDEIDKSQVLSKIKWIPDRYLAMLQLDEDILNTNKAPNAPNPYHKNNEIKISKVINTFWFSNDPIPDKYLNCVDSWKKYCSDYEIRIWSLNDYNPQGNRYFEEAISVRKWAFASDYSRIDIISRNGGIYMDLDVEIVKPIDDLLYNDAYLGFEDFERIDCGSGFGACAGNRIFEEIRAEYDNRSFIKEDGSYDLATCPQIYTRVLEKHGLKKNGAFQEVEGITVYPFEYLSAKSFQTGIIYRTENTYSIHHHEGSWLSDEAKKSNNSRYNSVEEFIKMINNSMGN